MQTGMGLLVLFAGLIGVLLVAIRGFRPRSSGAGRRRRQPGLDTYSASTRMAKVLVLVPVGWAIGKLAEPSGMSLGAVFALGAVVGAISLNRPTREVVVGIVGAVGLGWSIVHLLDSAFLESASALLVVGVTLAACAIGAAIALVAGSLRTWLPLVLMAAVELVVFGLELQYRGGPPPSIWPQLAVVLLVPPLVIVLVSIAPELMIGLLGIGLLVAEAMVQLGVVDGDMTGGAEVFAAAAGCSLAAWLLGRWLDPI